MISTDKFCGNAYDVMIGQVKIISIDKIILIYVPDIITS